MDDLLAMHRRDEEEDFDAAGTLTRVAGSPVFDPATGTYVTPETTVYDGPCTFRPMPSGARKAEAGDQTVQHRTYELTVPHNILPRVDDKFVLTASPDVKAAGTVAYVKGVVKDDWIASRKFLCEEGQAQSGGGS